MVLIYLFRKGTPTPNGLGFRYIYIYTFADAIKLIKYTMNTVMEKDGILAKAAEANSEIRIIEDLPELTRMLVTTSGIGKKRSPEHATN